MQVFVVEILSKFVVVSGFEGPKVEFVVVHFLLNYRTSTRYIMEYFLHWQKKTMSTWMTPRIGILYLVIKIAITIRQVT